MINVVWNTHDDLHVYIKLYKATVHVIESLTISKNLFIFLYLTSIEVCKVNKNSNKFCGYGIPKSLLKHFKETVYQTTVFSYSFLQTEQILGIMAYFSVVSSTEP